MSDLSNKETVSGHPSLNLSISSVELDNPFVGLRSYHYGEQLFGRDREALQLRDMLLANRLVLLHAPSGAGKTSLVEAQLRMLLREEQGIGIQLGLRKDGRGGIRLNTSPPNELTINRYVYSVISQLEEASASVDDLDLDEIGLLGLPEYFKRLSKSSKSDVDFLHFDQFEEVLRLDEGDTTDKEMFFQKLGLALRDPRWLVVFSIRDEYVGELEPYLRYLPTQLRARFRLDRLNRIAAGEAIAKTVAPLRKFQERAVRTLVENLVDKFSNFVEPSILQVVCTNLWDAIQPPDRTDITQEDVLDFDADTALRNFYEEGIKTVWNSSQPAVTESAIRAWFTDEMITSHVRKIVLRGQEATEGLPNSAVDQLVIRRLIVGEQRRGEMWYELAHDRLIRPVFDSNRDYFQKLEHEASLKHQAEVNELKIQDIAEKQKRQRQLWWNRIIFAGIVLFTISVLFVFYVLASFSTFPLKEGILAYNSRDQLLGSLQDIHLMEGGLTGYIKYVFGENPYRLRFDQPCNTGDASPDNINITTMEPAFANNGRLAFTVITGISRCIYVETSARSGTYRLLTDNGSQPAWSPDEAHIAFTRPNLLKAKLVDGNVDCAEQSDIFIMNSDGTGKVTNLRDLVGNAMPTINNYRFATFSPDGKSIAFESSPCISQSGDPLSFTTDSVESIHVSDVWIAQLDTDATVPCIVNVTKQLDVGSAFSHPVWLEQGLILISSSINDDTGIFAFDPPDVCAGSPRSLRMDQITRSPANEYAPTASADGRIVVYQSDVYAINENRAVLLDSRNCTISDITLCDGDQPIIFNDLRQITTLAYWKASQK